MRSLTQAVFHPRSSILYLSHIPSLRSLPISMSTLSTRSTTSTLSTLSTLSLTNNKNSCKNNNHLIKRNYKILASELKMGDIIDLDGKLLIVEDKEYSKSAMRKSSMGLELRDIMSGIKSPLRIQPASKIERVELESQAFTFLYRKGEILYFMNSTSFEQIEVDVKIAGDKADYLQEGMSIDLEYYKEKLRRIKFPHHMVLKVVNMDTRAGGSDGAMKNATLENGRTIKVSPRTEVGDWVKIKLDDESFVSKADGPEEVESKIVRGQNAQKK